tara:strand:- start:528 stop:785 length:258 start_codon:yes stop_codon:yes gene_type:complete
VNCQTETGKRNNAKCVRLQNGRVRQNASFENGGGRNKLVWREIQTTRCNHHEFLGCQPGGARMQCVCGFGPDKGTHGYSGIAKRN